MEAGARTLKEAVSAAIRDWVANVADTHYVIGSAVGPAPYPALVRDLQRVIGDEIREQVQAAEGRLPDRVIACVGGGSNAIGAFVPFVRDASVELVGVEAAGEGLDSGRHSAPLTTGARGVLHGALSAVLQDERRARSWRPTRSPPASTTPAPAPSTRGCATRAGCATRRCPTRTPLAAFRRARAAGGDHPRAGARARAGVAAGQPRATGLDVLVLSGRGDKDLAEVLADERRRRSEWDGGSAAAFAGHAGRAALMPYLMGGHPDVEDVARRPAWRRPPARAPT